MSAPAPITTTTAYGPSTLSSMPDVPIVEIELDERERASVDALRREVLRRIDEHGGIQPTVNFHTPVQGHWRETYEKHAHLTQYKVAPLASDAPVYSPSTDPSAWTDLLLLRFVRARKHDVHKAANMFMNYLHFRLSYGVDDLARQQPMPFDDIITSIIGHRIHGVDKRGFPVYFQRTGKINGSEFVRRVPDDVLMLTHVHFVESMVASLEQASRKLGRRVYQSVTVLDLTGLSLPLARTLKFFKLTSFIDQHYYPEMLGALYMANAPMIFHHMYASAKLFLDPVTQAKIHVVGTQHTRTTLVNSLGAECLPVEYGGTCVCAPECLPNAQMMGSDAGAVAEVEAIEKEQADGPQVVQIAAGRAHEIELIIPGVADSGSSSPKSGGNGGSSGGAESLPDTEHVVWWSFEITAKDIDFSVTVYPPTTAAAVGAAGDAAAAGSPTELVPQSRLASRPQQPPYRGLQALNGAQGGRVVLRWSNTYSVWSGKEVRVRAGLHQRRVADLAQDIAQMKLEQAEREEDGDE